jgi:hypothetical protein
MRDIPCTDADICESVVQIFVYCSSVVDTMTETQFQKNITTDLAGKGFHITKSQMVPVTKPLRNTQMHINTV